jgi:hypothetical protein
MTDITPCLRLMHTVPASASPPVHTSAHAHAHARIPPQIYVLHAHQEAGDGSVASPPVAVLDYVSVFAVVQPVLSLAACSETGVQDGPGADVFQLYTVQTEAVQEYTLHPAACFPRRDLVGGGGGGGSTACVRWLVGFMCILGTCSSSPHRQRAACVIAWRFPHCQTGGFLTA